MHNAQTLTSWVSCQSLESNDQLGWINPVDDLLQDLFILRCEIIQVNDQLKGFNLAEVTKELNQAFDVEVHCLYMNAMDAQYREGYSLHG